MVLSIFQIAHYSYVDAYIYVDVGDHHDDDDDDDAGVGHINEDAWDGRVHIPHHPHPRLSHGVSVLLLPQGMRPLSASSLLSLS